MTRSLGLIVVMVILAACVGSDTVEPTSEPAGQSSEPAPSTVPVGAAPASEPAQTVDAPDLRLDPSLITPDPFEEALGERLDDDGTVPLDAAVDLFSAVFGAFPEGDPAAFPTDDPHAATLAVMAVAANFDALTSEQQAAFLSAVEPDADMEAIVLSMGGASAVQVGYQSAAQPEPDEYSALVSAARDEIALRVGRPLGIPVRLMIRSGTERVAMASPMRAGDFVSDGSPDECLVELWPERLPAGDFTRSVITHEVFHCYQYTAFGDLAETWETAPWITEGQAFWAAAEIVGGTQPWVSAAYTDWLCHPEISLWKRTRASMGFYSAVATHGPGHIWPALEDMLGLSRVAAVEALGISGNDALRVTATSRMNDSGAFGSEWSLRGVGLPASACRGSGSAGPDAPWEWSRDLQPFAASPPFVVNVSGDVVRVDALSEAGAIEFSDGTTVPWTEAATRILCLRDEGCECPDGRTIGDGSAAPGETAVAAGAWTGHGSVSLLPFTLEDACVEIADLPRLSLRGNPTIDLEGGACTIDGGSLILVFGYEPSYDARLQPEPTPQMNALIFVRAVPGTWDTGSFYISPVAGGAFREGDGDLHLGAGIRVILVSAPAHAGGGSGGFVVPSALRPESQPSRRRPNKMEPISL